MKNFEVKLFFIVGFVATLSACFHSKDSLESFKDGDSVAWHALAEDSTISSESDCGKIITATNGMLNFEGIENGSRFTLLYWGGMTSKAKYAEFPLQVDRNNGKRFDSKILSSSLDKTSLTITTQRTPTSTVEFLYNYLNSEKSLVSQSAKLITGTEKEIEDDKILINAGMIKPTTVGICSMKSLKDYLNAHANTSKEPDIKITNALDYVIGKKWSIGSLNCDLNGGAFTIYTRESPGIIPVTGGKFPENNNKRYQREEPSFSNISEKGFTLIQRFYAEGNPVMLSMVKGDPNVLTAEDIREIEIVSPTKIKVTDRYKQIDWNLLSKGEIGYTVKVSTSEDILCGS